jgi:hypothetical protein
MPPKKVNFSQLPPAEPLNGSEVVPAWQVSPNYSGGRTVKLPLGQNLVASGRITYPRPQVDLLLPPAALFRITLIDFLFSVDNDELAFVVSQDEGATWINDAVNFDSYAIVGLGIQGIPATGVGPIEGGPDNVYLDSAMGLAINPSSASHIRSFASMDIVPGSPGSLTQVMIRTNAGNDVSPLNMEATFGAMALNPNATIVPTLAPANALRIAPYGSGDLVVPSGHVIISGSWILEAWVVSQGG